MLRLSFLATHYSSSRQLDVKESKLYENLTYDPHAAHSYRVKLPHWEYTEWRTPENIWKIPIQLTSVGLAHTRPNYKQV